MKHNLLKSVILSVILLMGVSNAWGASYPLTVNYPYVYLDNSSLKWDGCNVVVGHGSYSYGYLMTKLENTNLFYKEIPANWTDATGIVFVNGTTEWGEYKNQSLYDRTNTKTRTGYKWDNEYESMDYHKTYYCTSSGSNSLTISYKENGFTAIPTYNATQAAKLRNDITRSYAPVNGTWPTTLKLQGTYLSGDGASARSEISGTASNDIESNRVYGAVVTGKITHTYNTISGNYIFEGWGTGDTPSTTNDSYEYNITANTTVYAFFTKAHTVTYGKKGESGSSTVSAKATANNTTKSISSGTKVAAGSTITLNASPASGYRVVGWYSDANCTNQLQNGGDTYNAGTLTAAKTVYVKFEETKYDVTIQAGANGSVSPSGVQKVGNITPVNIKAIANDECEFVNWTKIGNITITKANNSATTIKATGTGTVTANFRKIEYTTVYLKPGAWSSDDARFAVYAYVDNDNYDWYDMIPVGCSNEYYQCNISKKYTNVIFCRMNPSKPANNWDNKWNQTTNLSVSANKIWTFTEWDNNSDGKDEGTWTSYNPTVTLTLKSSSNGIYRVRNNGNTYVSSLTEDVVVELPINTEINIAEEGAHVPNAGYMLKECFIQIGNNAKEKATIETQKYELCGSTTISANFVTKEDNTVYLKPNANWISSNAKFAVYLYDEAGEETWIELEEAEGYYTCVIPKGWSNLIFVRLDPNGGLNWDKRWSQTYSHHIPVTRYNAYTLHADTWGNAENEGWWSQPEATNGDYRLLYVEQVVEKEDWKTVINRTKQHPSDIIKKRSAAGSDIVSLHIYTQGDNPEVILQQYNGSRWVDIEAHMVNGPLEALPGTAMLPGRKNASPDSDKDDFVYDDGIEVIKTDDEDAGCGVWNFTIVQDGSTATLDLTADGLKRYEGKYYIRTDASAGGWSSYTIPANYMTFSSYSKTHSDFSHYYCQWILQGTNVKFTIANDYGYAISDTLDGDSFVPKEGVNVGLLSEDANIRFSWNQVNNNIYRAYIKGAYNPSTHDRLENIVATYKTESDAANKEVILDDSGNWIYQKDITDVKVGSSLESLIAEYRDVRQIFEENIPMLTGGDSETYTVRILYDFKIDKTLVTLVPNNKEANISIDVLIERVNQGEANQVLAGINAARTQEGSTVYAVMSFTQDHIESSKTEWERLYYWVSFPFDVRISEVFGFGEYGEHWIMQYYDGEERAAKGCWIDSPTYWRFITDTTGNDWTNGVLKANKGYVLALTTDIADLNIFQHTKKVSLYFPSTTLISNINADVINTTVELEPYTCTIERNNRKLYDSNWHIIGIPSYANKDQTLKQSDLFYFYTYNTANNTYSVTTADPRDSEETVGGNNVTFKSMHSYMVQYAGTINWEETWVLGAKGLAAKTSDREDQTHSLRLELQQSNTLADKTFIKLQDKAGITDEFDLNIDLTKIINSGANIYTLAGTELIQLAGNVLPIQETVIPLGVVISAAGEYTFAMPDGTDGIVVELIDYETNTRTNMLLDEYTVNLGKGTFENRFALHVKPNKVTTSLEDINTNTTGVKKYLIDGVLYMQKDGVLYDAQGRCVQ